MKLTILVALAITAFTTSLFTTSAHATESIGRIVGQLGMTEGDVFVDNKAVTKNTPVREGATIEIKKGKATLLLGTGSVFHLAANTKMIVNQFGMRADSKKEGGDVELRFGRTRALILNKGDETKDVRIKTRSATMGVRGTEVFVSVDKNPAIPVQFFTMEGHAVVDMPKAPSIPVKQNEGVSASNAGKSSVTTLSVAEVKSDIKNSGMIVSSINTPHDMRKSAGDYGDIGIRPGDIPRVNFDPIQDRLTPLKITPHFCNATGPGC